MMLTWNGLCCRWYIDVDMCVCVCAADVLRLVQASDLELEDKKNRSDQWLHKNIVVKVAGGAGKKVAGGKVQFPLSCMWQTVLNQNAALFFPSFRKCAFISNIFVQYYKKKGYVLTIVDNYGAELEMVLSSPLPSPSLPFFSLFEVGIEDKFRHNQTVKVECGSVLVLDQEDLETVIPKVETCPFSFSCLACLFPVHQEWQHWTYHCRLGGALKYWTVSGAVVPPPCSPSTKRSSAPASKLIQEIARELSWRKSMKISVNTLELEATEGAQANGEN